MLQQLSITRDQVLSDEYDKIPDKSSEEIIRDPDLSARLLRQVNKRLSSDQKFEQIELSHRLENLRKSGKLNRKFRDFNGRNLNITQKKPK